MSQCPALPVWYERTVVAAGVLVLTSCGGDASEAPAPDVPAWELAAPDLRIETDGSGAPLPPVEHLVAGPDGRAYSLHGGEWFVRSWAADGSPAGVLGDAQAAQDLLPDPRGMGLWGDALWVADGLTHRLRFFGPDGEARGTIQVGVPSLPGDGPSWGLPPRLLRPLPDGRVPGGAAEMASLQELSLLGAEPEVSEAVARGEQTRTAYVRMDVVGSVLDTVWVRDWRPEDALALPRDGTTAYGAQPFADAPLVGATPEGGLVILDRRVGGSPGGGFSVTWIDASGDTVGRAELSDSPRDVSPARVEEAVTELAARWSGFLLEAGDSLDADALGERIRSALYLPPQMPPVTSLVVASDGSAWLRRPESRESVGDGPGTVEWWVVGADGAFRARVSAPRDLRILWAGSDHVLGTVDGADGSATIVRHAIRR